jgi:phosphatidylserine/phosphatidylglycerophosphate/cardiolipin synthase-like enzyme
VDLEQARKMIVGAKQAVLFLMFNPGPKGTLLNSIIETARRGTAGKRLYIHGVINQDPSTTKNPVELFQEQNSEKADFETVLPAAIDDVTAYWTNELRKLPGTFAMVHSKVVLIDPFGNLTGSHNLGPKASGTNDENLLIIRDSHGLASAYATNIMSVYNQYRWRFRRQTQAKSRRWKGLEDTDTWQEGYLKPGSIALREIDFWVGA